MPNVRGGDPAFDNPQIIDDAGLVNQVMWADLMPHPPVEAVIQPLATKPKKASKTQVSKGMDTPLSELFLYRLPPQTRTPEFLRDLQNSFPEFQSTYHPRNPKTLVGIEVEVENVLRIDPNIPTLWHIEQDGSLRDNGKEFISSPLPLGYVEFALRLLKKELNPDLSFSKRTSTHIHLDIRQFTMEQLYNLIFLYTAVENLFFKFAGTDRRSNNFCVPIAESSVLEIMSANVTPQNLSEYILGSWHKYAAFNILPVTNQGTVEFRHMPGGLDIEKLLVWCDLLGRLKAASYTTTFDELSNRIFHLNTSSQYLEFITNIFGDLSQHLDTRFLLQDMEKNILVLKSLSKPNPFHQRVMTDFSALENSLLSSQLISRITPEQKEALKEIVLFIRKFYGQDWSDKKVWDYAQQNSKRVLSPTGDWVPVQKQMKIILCVE